jgi:hypothetical protein
MATMARGLGLLALALVLGTSGCSALLDTSSLKGGKLDTGRDASPDRRKIDGRIVDKRAPVEQRADRVPPAPDLKLDRVVSPEGKVPDKTVVPEAKAPDGTVVPEAKVPDASKPDASKPDAPKPDAPKPDAPKPDAPKPDAPKLDAPPAQA